MILIFKVLTLVLSFSSAFDITLIPQNPVVLEHQNITFNCTASNHKAVIDFAINDTNIEQRPEGEGFYKIKSCVLENSNWKEKTLTINGSTEYNNTIIGCIVSLEHDKPKLKEVTLLVQGPIDSVGSLESTKSYFRGVSLRWNPPHILHGLRITGYYIDYLNTTVTKNYALIHPKDILKPCQETVVNVTAIVGTVTGKPASTIFQWINTTSNDSIKVEAKLLKSRKNSITLDLILTENACCLFDHGDLPSKINITIDGKNYTRGLERSGRNIKNDKPIILNGHKKELVGSITLGSESFQFNFSTLAISVTRDSNCFTCKFISNTSTERGCLVNLTAKGGDDIAIEFRRSPSSSLKVFGCINSPNLSFYDISVYTIDEEGLLNSEPVQYWKKKNSTLLAGHCHGGNPNAWCIPTGSAVALFFLLAAIFEIWKGCRKNKDSHSKKTAGGTDGSENSKL